MRAGRGQIVLEHVLLAGIAIGLFLMLQAPFQRGAQGMIKGAADQMHAEGDKRDLQAEGLSYESGDRQTFGEGSVLTREAASSTASTTQVRMTEQPGGIRRQEFTDANNYTSTTGTLNGRGQKAASYSEVVAHVEDKPKKR